MGALIVSLAEIISFKTQAVERLAAGAPLSVAWTVFLSSLFLGTDLSLVGGLGFLAVFAQALTLAVFLALLFVPALMILSNWAAGDGFSLRFPHREYVEHLRVFFLLWGAMGLLLVLLKVLIPAAVVLVYLGLMGVYTVFSLKTLNYLSLGQALLAFSGGLLTLPLALFATGLLFSLPFFVLLFLLFLAARQVQEFLRQAQRARQHQQYLGTLTINPSDADAHFQLGLICFERKDFEGAKARFEKASEIDTEEPEYQYYLGLVEEEIESFGEAFEHFEKVYYRDPNYKFGELKRELGKVYVNMDHMDEGIRFLDLYLQEHSSDAEARWWLAFAYTKKDDLKEAQHHLSVLIDSEQSFHPFKRKETRKWQHHGRRLLARLAQPSPDVDAKEKQFPGKSV